MNHLPRRAPSGVSRSLLVLLCGCLIITAAGASPVAAGVQSFAASPSADAAAGKAARPAACRRASPLVRVRHHHRHAALSHGRSATTPARDFRRDLPEGLALRSNAAYIFDEASHEVLADRNPDQVQPIASITKLMTAVVVLQQGFPLDELVEIADADVDTLRHTHSLLRVGSRYTRHDLLLLALMSSENRAAAALGRSMPEGRDAFVAQMNATAAQLGMQHTHFADTSGLNGGNESSARDLATLVRFAGSLPQIHEFTTTPEARVAAMGGRGYVFRNTNLLVRQGEWDVVVSKTGFINESGQCLVMQARIDGKVTTMVLLDSRGRLGRINDAQQVRRWLEARAASAAKVGVLVPAPRPNDS
jgi:D-alanyl-D-alanine endopeptidase (penicillin-binding protein 7)